MANALNLQEVPILALNFPILLGPIWNCRNYSDAELFAEFLELCAYKLRPIVACDGQWYPMASEQLVQNTNHWFGVDLLHHFYLQEPTIVVNYCEDVRPVRQRSQKIDCQVSQWAIR